MTLYVKVIHGVRINACLVPVFPADMQTAFICNSEDFALSARGACTDRDYGSLLELQLSSL